MIQRHSSQPAPRIFLCSGLFLCLIVAAAMARTRAHGENIHRPGAPCGTCHVTGNAAELNGNRARARTDLRPDMEAQCNRCHGSQGPSHKTNVVARPNVPAELPLGAGRKLTCGTCHWMHGEDHAFADLLRMDNRRGKLCLSCHTMSELER